VGPARIAASGLSDALSAWAEPGRPGWFPDAWDASEFPRAFAGLALGGARIDEPGAAPPALPRPGVDASRRSIAWRDSLAASALDDGGREGFDGTLAHLGSSARAPGRGRAGTMLQWVTGANGYASDALSVERGDQDHGIRLEMLAGNRGAAGALERAGWHVWGGSVHGGGGPHAWQGWYAQRGSGGRLADNDEENVAGESGNFAYRYRARGWSAGLDLARGYTHHESSGDTLTYSRRDAGENRIAGEANFGLAGSLVAARLEWRDAIATRVTGGWNRESRVNRLGWGSVRAERDLAGGRLTGSVGAGHDEASDRTEVAPSLSWRRDGLPFAARVGVGRLVDPVWSDLAAGVAPFMQSTWAVGSELGLEGSRGRLRALLVAGRTTDRALIERLPLADLWMRSGAGHDALRYRFALANLGGEAHAGLFDGGAEGFALGRDRDNGLPVVDPSWGARAHLGVHFTAFKRDLGVALRGEGEWVGPRDTEEAVPQRLPAISSAGATAVLTLADAVLTFRVRNLEDHPQPQTWIDGVTGAPALGPGLEFRLVFTWRLSN